MESSMDEACRGEGDAGKAVISVSASILGVLGQKGDACMLWNGLEKSSWVNLG